MSKADVDVPEEILTNPDLLGKVMELLSAEFKYLWPQVCEGGDPTFIYHCATHRMDVRVSFWGPKDSRDHYISGFLRGICVTLLDDVKDKILIYTVPNTCILTSDPKGFYVNGKPATKDMTIHKDDEITCIPSEMKLSE